ncbi:Uncharacterised protein [Vibrio cholerae]|nr:Uncharacterised protein [Vibrio cholerae]
MPKAPFNVVKSNTPYHWLDCSKPEKKTTAKANAM